MKHLRLLHVIWKYCYSHRQLTAALVSSLLRYCVHGFGSMFDSQKMMPFWATIYQLTPCKQRRPYTKITSFQTEGIRLRHKYNIYLYSHQVQP